MAPTKQEKAPPYSKDEKVLCFHGDLMYEAKIIDLRIEPGKKPDDAQYRIHYKGWKSSWDDWVTHDRIRKLTEDNKQLAAQLVQARTRTPGSKGAKKGTKATGSEMSSARGSEERAAASSSFAGRGPRRGRDYELETTPVLGVTTHIPRIHGAGTPREELNVGGLIMTPPPSLTPGNVRPAKVRRQTTSRTPITRKQAPRKHTPSSSLSKEDIIMIKNLPKELRSFAEKEMCWSNAQAALDPLLTLPSPTHRYVDGKRRLICNDSRFTMYEERKIDTSYFVSAGIPLKKTYAPYYEAASPPVHLTTSGSLEGSTFDETANTSQEEAFHSRPSVKLIIPDVIKALLVDDWENVTKNTQLVPLPHPKPVTKILEDYSAYEMPKRPAGSSHADILEETLSGLKEYFDKSLGRILLYKFERPQYAEVHKKWNSTDPEFQGKTASDVYGAEHLCRLIVSLPELLAQTNMDQQSVNRLREELAKFSTWLSKNATEYFVSSYETPTQDYVDKAKN
ncbi:hypothetical protein GQX73_g8764 [Xylaria multiplex]|uniref:Chromatin modification-related protein EAF3 n=1 Tax=Xylaria multiplex TaxID=323545 RepID=A0A7C8IVH2_9PEZI|nr:hypothetical protein GQX73_g8764 [Xylaria multiplex]